MEKLQENSLNWAMKHIEKFGDTDLFPVPFEYEAIQKEWDYLKPFLLDIDLETHEARPANRFLIPKPQGGYRAAHQLDPIDTIIYSAIAYEVANEVEDFRTSIELQVACSYRIEIDETGQMFKPQSGWNDYHEKSESLAHSEDYEFVLLADIADFYNQIGHHRIQNALESAGITSSKARAIERFLGNFTARQSRGVPVGPSASILLAEACLSDVDSRLARKGYTHTRYVDDFRIFCRTKNEAEKALHDLSEYLYTSHRLALQSHKTKIITLEDFINKELFDAERAEENSKLNRIKEELGFYSSYGENIEVIEPEERMRLVRENLKDLMLNSLCHDQLNLGFSRYLLRKATQLKTGVLQDIVIENLPVLLPVFRDAMNYLIKTCKPNRIEEIGNSLINFLESDYSFMPFAKLWIFHCLSTKFSTSFENKISQILAEENDVRHIAMLAKERNYVEWIREKKELWNIYGSWDKRAVLWSASALSPDERRHWLNSISNAGDKLDEVVIRTILYHD